MKVLMLNASPRKTGSVSRMLECFEAALPPHAQREIVFLSEHQLRPCVGCMRCRTSLECAFAGDDADSVGAKMQEADILVVAAPTYWANMPGTLKLLFDRNAFRFMGETKSGIPIPLMKGKRGLIITACSTPFPFNVFAGQSSGLVKSVREIFRTSGMRYLGAAVCPGTKRRPGPSASVLSRVRKLAESAGRSK
jgi:NAD(P)H-dependent FMN reductase